MAGSLWFECKDGAGRGSSCVEDSCPDSADDGEDFVGDVDSAYESFDENADGARQTDKPRNPDIDGTIDSSSRSSNGRANANGTHGPAKERDGRKERDEQESTRERKSVEGNNRSNNLFARKERPRKHWLSGFEPDSNVLSVNQNDLARLEELEEATNDKRLKARSEAKGNTEIDQRLKASGLFESSPESDEDWDGYVNQLLADVPSHSGETSSHGDCHLDEETFASGTFNNIQSCGAPSDSLSEEYYVPTNSQMNGNPFGGLDAMSPVPPNRSDPPPEEQPADGDTRVFDYESNWWKGATEEEFPVPRALKDMVKEYGTSNPKKLGAGYRVLDQLRFREVEEVVRTKLPVDDVSWSLQKDLEAKLEKWKQSAPQQLNSAPQPSGPPQQVRPNTAEDINRMLNPRSSSTPYRRLPGNRLEVGGVVSHDPDGIFDDPDEYYSGFMGHDNKRNSSPRRRVPDARRRADSRDRHGNGRSRSRGNHDRPRRRTDSRDRKGSSRRRNRANSNSK